MSIMSAVKTTLIIISCIVKTTFTRAVCRYNDFYTATYMFSLYAMFFVREKKRLLGSFFF